MGGWRWAARSGVRRASRDWKRERSVLLGSSSPSAPKSSANHRGRACTSYTRRVKHMRATGHIATVFVTNLAEEKLVGGSKTYLEAQDMGAQLAQKGGNSPRVGATPAVLPRVHVPTQHAHLHSEKQTSKIKKKENKGTQKENKDMTTIPVWLLFCVGLCDVCWWWCVLQWSLLQWHGEFFCSMAGSLSAMFIGMVHSC